MLESQQTYAIAASHWISSSGADGFWGGAGRAALSRPPAIRRNSSPPAAVIRRDHRSAEGTARKAERTDTDFNPDAGITLPLERRHASLSLQDLRQSSRRDGLHS